MAASISRYTCPLLSLAAAFAAGIFRRPQDDREPPFLFLASKMKGGANAINNWLKPLCPGSDNISYKEFQVAGLPADATAGGWRVGTYQTRRACDGWHGQKRM